jgi:hypothetical protein
VRPYALDTASGTESAPGHKDYERMAALFAAVREADGDPNEVASAAAPSVAGTLRGAP